MKRFKPFFAIFMGLFLYQNCGEYKALSDGESSQLSVPALSLNIRSLELKRYIGNTGDYFQTAKIQITESSIFAIIDESEICQRSFRLTGIEEQQVYDVFQNLTYRQKNSDFPSESRLISELRIEDNDGNIKEANVVTSADQELSLEADAEILVQSQDLVNLMDALMAKQYTGEQESCMSQQEIPRFVEYVWTDVVNNNSVAREGFWFESQNNGNDVFLSGLNSEFCFEAFLLNMQERAVAIKALSRIVLDANTATPVNVNGVRYIDYRLSSKGIDNPDRYYIDGSMAPADSQILNNGEAITDLILFVVEQARARYTAAGQTATEIGRCVFR